jgi:Transposase DDE domain
MIWLDRDLQWSGMASGEGGRTQSFTDAKIQMLPDEQGPVRLGDAASDGHGQNLLKLAGLPWQEPDCSTICRRQKTLKVQTAYRQAAQWLHLLVDSTGLNMMVKGDWKRKKHGAEYRRQWSNLDLVIDAQAIEIRALKVTPNSVDDAPMLTVQLAQIDPDEALLSVSGFGAYDIKACQEAIARREAQAIIPI